MKKTFSLFASALCIGLTLSLLCSGLELVLKSEYKYSSYMATTYTDGLGVVDPDSPLGQQHQKAVSNHDALLEQMEANNGTNDGAIQSWFKSSHNLVKLLTIIFALCMSCLSIAYIGGQIRKFCRDFRRLTTKRRAHY